MNNRIELAKYFAELGFKTGAEVGVLKGEYSKELYDMNPGLKLYCIDAWGMLDRSQKMKIYHTKMYKFAKHRLAPYGATLIKEASAKAAPQFSDNYFDFVYIDANHCYSAVKEDIELWTKKVRQGGIVSGHDYDNEETKRAIDEYVTQNNYKLNSTQEVKSSWWFVKDNADKIN